MFTVKIVIEDSDRNSATTFSVAKSDVAEVRADTIDFINRVTAESFGVCYRLKIKADRNFHPCYEDFIKHNRIKAIKCIRTITNLGLKDAKDIVDNVSSGGESVLPTVFDSPNSIELAKTVLRQYGFSAELVTIKEV